MPIVTSRPRESLNKIHLLHKKLQAVVLRATVGGHTDAIERAIDICHNEFNIKFGEHKSTSNDVLDTFPEDLGVKVCVLLLLFIKLDKGGTSVDLIGDPFTLKGERLMATCVMEACNIVSVFGFLGTSKLGCR